MTDHLHPEYWTERDHDRFEDRISKEIHDLRLEAKALATRMAWILGGLGVLIFVVGLLSPLLQGILQLPTP